MSSYLDEYGVDDARRERLFKRLVLIAVIAAAVGGLLYWKFRDYREERQVKAFLRLLESQDFQSAYALWGCSEQNPCPQYPFQKFIEDWGPKGAHRNIAAAEFAQSRSCKQGVIQAVRLGPDDEVLLWVDRTNRQISYAPWPVCDPRLPSSNIER